MARPKSKPRAARAKKAQRNRAKRKRRANRARHAVPVPAGSAKSVLRRILAYGEKVFGLNSGLREVRDGRVKPRIPAGRVALAYLLVLLGRLGSLNALEQRQAPSAYAKWLGGPLPSADVMGTVAATLELEQIRELLRRQHAKLKRNKGFPRGRDGFRYLVLDGHEALPATSAAGRAPSSASCTSPKGRTRRNATSATWRPI